MNSEKIENIREALQLFIGPKLNEIQLSERQKKAIQELIKLPENKYIIMCEDIVNVINYHNGILYENKGIMFEKMKNLSEDKFRDLVIDVLLVFNYKNPGNKLINLDKFMETLDIEIDNLKKKSKGENFINRIKDMELPSIFSEYNRYVEVTTTIDNEIIKGIDRIINKSIEYNGKKVLGFLGEPLKFLNIFDQTELNTNEKYLFHKENILRIVNKIEVNFKKKNKNYKKCIICGLIKCECKNNHEIWCKNCNKNKCDYKNECKCKNEIKNENENNNLNESNLINYKINETKFDYKNLKDDLTENESSLINYKTKIIKKEMVMILNLYIDETYLNIYNSLYLEGEMKILLNILEMIKSDLNGTMCINIEKLGYELEKVLDLIKDKLKNIYSEETDFLKSLLKKKESLKAMKYLKKKQDAFRIILKIINELLITFEN